MIDCSECKHIYFHHIVWRELWCSRLNKEIYSLHELNKKLKMNVIILY